MSFWGVFFTCFGMILLAFMAFMAAAFSGSGLANGRNLNKETIQRLDRSMWLLPAIPIISMILLIVGYQKGWSAQTYWWCLLIIPFWADYSNFKDSIVKNPERHHKPPDA